jgi:hypothetical protein
MRHEVLILNRARKRLATSWPRIEGTCSGAVTAKLWTFRLEYFCATCREYEWGGSKVRGFFSIHDPFFPELSR